MHIHVVGENSTMNQIKELIEKYWEKVKEYRIWLHMHPEASGAEIESSAYIAKVLREIGLNPIEKVGGYGVVAIIEGNGPGKCVGLRADFDALQLTEETNLPFSSQNPGLAHSCGHDTHAAMLLGIAHILNEMRDQFSGTVKLIFQPAEEVPTISGAKKMIADGVLENPKVDAIFAQHVSPLYEVGKVSSRDGIRNGASDRFKIVVCGKKSHGARPQSGIDAIVIASYVVTALQTIVARNIDPHDSTVLTIGTINGGTAANIIADKVVLEGTCRNLQADVRETMPKHIEDVVKGVVGSMEGDYQFEYIKGYPPAVNSHDCFEIVRGVVSDTLGSENFVVPEYAGLGGEDFAFYCEKIPGEIHYVGCRDMKKPFYPLHSGAFYPEWEALPIGMEILIKSALKYLNT